MLYDVVVALVVVVALAVAFLRLLGADRRDRAQVERLFPFIRAPKPRYGNRRKSID